MSFTGSNWGRRVLLTGLTPSASLTGFVALVSLDNIPVEAVDTGVNSALNGGGDLRFSTDDAGVNQLPLEVVSYVNDSVVGSRSCQLWIRFPDYASGTREVYMFYGKAGEVQPAVTASFGRNEVWQDSSLSQHFTATAPVDSSGNQTVASIGSPISDGESVDFNGTSQYLSVADDPSIESKPIFTMIVDYDPEPAGNQYLFWKRASSGGYAFVHVKNSNQLRFTLFGISDYNFNTAFSTRVLVHCVVDGDTVEMFLNGVFIGSSVISTSRISTETDLHIAARTSSAGVIDGYSGQQVWRSEYCNIAKNAAVISSEYDNQSSPSTFWITGTPEDTGGTPSTFKPFWARNIINNQLLGA